VHASGPNSSKTVQQNMQPSYGMYQPQADSDDDDVSDEVAVSNALDHYPYLSSPQSSQQHRKASSQNYGTSNIQFEDDTYNSSTRAGDDDSDYYADRYIPSAPQPQSKLQTRGHSVPSSTASGLYSRPQTGDDENYDYNAPVEAYAHVAPVADAASAAVVKKKKRATYSANSRIQQAGAHNSSYSSTRDGADSESDTDDGYYSKDKDTPLRAAAGLGPTRTNDLANYLYGGAPDQPKMTRRAAGASLPHLPPARIVDSGRAHSIVAAKQQASRIGLEKETRLVTDVSDRPRKVKKKVKGALQLGGLASRRR
jgi:hypothetical protein